MRSLSIARAGVSPVSAVKRRGEVARAHRRLLGQMVDAQIFIQPLARPGEQRAEPAARPFQIEQRRELRLAARPLAIDDELLGGAAGDLLAQILGDQRER